MSATKSDWTTATLESIADRVDYGHTASAVDDAIGPKFLRITDIQNGHVEWEDVPYCRTTEQELEQYRLGCGDIVFARTGATTGKSFLISECPGDAVFASYLIRVRPGRSVDPRYLSYFFGTPDYWSQIKRHAKGAGQPGVNASSLKSLAVPLPPLSEQKRIADILDKADAIRRKRQTIGEASRALFKSTFHRSFGREFLTRRDCVPLESLIDEDRGISYGVVQRGTHNPDGVPVARISNIVNNEFDDSDFVRVAQETSDQYKRSVLNGGEILVSIRGTVGKAAIAPRRAAGWNVTREVAVIPLRPEIPRHFIHQLILTDEAQRFISGNVKGVAQKGINLRDLRLLPVPSPDSNDVEEFIGQIGKLEEFASKTFNCAIHSVNLFDSLVQRAFRGEL